MDNLFGLLDGTIRISIIDATMMWIVYYAMDKAHGKVKSKEGVIARLNEISKFYELAVIQLEGCIKFVQEETDSYILENCHERVLADLTEIRDRLLGRLKESELAISKKDMELKERLENELKLRQALELKEREVASLHAILELERKKSENVAELALNNPESGDEMDQQVRLNKQLEPDCRLVNEETNRGIDNEKVEQLSNDINVLKESLDQAFNKLQNAIFLSEMGPEAQKWKWNIEKDAICTLIKGYMKDFKETFEVEMRKQEKQVLTGLSEQLSDLMKEVKCLRNDLEHFINQNEDWSKAIDGHENLVSSSQANVEYNIPPKPARSKSVGDNWCNSKVFSFKVEEVGQKQLRQDEPEEDGCNHVAKMMKNHESIIRRKNEELNWLKREMLPETVCSSFRKENEPVSLRRKIQEVIVRLDSLINCNTRPVETVGEYGGGHGEATSSAKATFEFDLPHKLKSGFDSLEDVWKKVNKASGSDTEHKELQNEIRMLKEEKEDGNFRMVVMEDTYAVIFQCLLSEFHTQLHACGVKRDGKFFSSKDRESEHFQDVGTLREDICRVFFREMCKEWSDSIESYSTEILLREEICWMVFDETVRDIVNTANYTLSKLQEVKVPENFMRGFSISSESHEIEECLVKENVFMVFFKEIIDEWKAEIDSTNIENLIREEMHRFIIFEVMTDACISCIEREAQKQDKTSGGISYGSMQVNGGESLIEKLDMLLKCFEDDEVLMLSTSHEIKEHEADLDLVELKEPNDRDSFQEMLNENETTFSSVRTRLEKALVQLTMSNTMLSELKYSVGTTVSDPERLLDQVTTTADIVHDRKSCQQNSSKEIHMDQFDSIFTHMQECSQLFMNFELQAHEKLGENFLRLEEVKQQLDSLAELVNSVKKRESLYRKAFIMRCWNLQKAENEVDLLGDQVDILSSLLEKIYIILHQYSPVLQHYLEISEILDLIEKELLGAVHASSKC